MEMIIGVMTFIAGSLGPFNGAGDPGPPSGRRFSNWGDQRSCPCVTSLQPCGSSWNASQVTQLPLLSGHLCLSVSL